jgi:hypothetical protein
MLLDSCRERIDAPFPMPFLDVVLLIKFSKFYKLFVRRSFAEM